ncbi:unnamed protein product, partial [Ceratitis capitata]
KRWQQQQNNNKKGDSYSARGKLSTTTTAIAAENKWIRVSGVICFAQCNTGLNLIGIGWQKRTK